MPSFTVPYTDDQMDVDTDLGLVLLFRNAWNRESSGSPDETYSFAVLRADSALLARLAATLAATDAAELRRLVAGA